MESVECMSSRLSTCQGTWISPSLPLSLSLSLSSSLSPSLPLSPPVHHGWPPADLRASIWLGIAWEHRSFSTLIKATARVSQIQTYSVCLHPASLPRKLPFFLSRNI